MNLDARTERTLLRLFSLFLALGGGDALVQFMVTESYDYRHLAGALVAAAIAAFEKWFVESDPNIAAPTIRALDITLRTVLHNPVISVPPPKLPLPPAVVEDH